MNARLDYGSSEVLQKFGKHINAAGMALRSVLPSTISNLVLIRASQINGCAVCLDMHTKDAEHVGETSLRLNLVASWRDAKVFTDAERAALELAEQGTRIADGAGGVTDEAWANAAKYFDADQLAALVCTIGLINLYNRGNHRNRQLVKLRVLKSVFLLVSVAGVAVWAIVAHGDNRQRAGCGDGGGPAGATASRLSGQILGCAFRRAGPACAERPYVVTNRVRPGAARGRPGSRHRATGFMQGAAGLPMVSRELWRSTSMRARLRPPGKARVRAGGSEDRACPGCCQLTQRLPSYGRVPGRRRWPGPRPGRR